MKTLLSTLVLFITFAPAFCQTVTPCGFKDPNAKSHHNQYSMSKKAAEDKSKKEMAEQSDEFDKKKYQSIVKAKTPARKKAVRML